MPQQNTGPEGNGFDSLAALPATDQPASKHILKLMLLCLQKDLRNELWSSISLHSRFYQVEKRTDDLENVIAEHTMAYNDIANAYDHHTEEICLLQAKVADLKE